MKKRILSLLVCAALCLCLAPLAALAAGPVTVTIFTTNDVHGVVAAGESNIGLAQVAAIKASTPNALLVDAGDATQGASFATVNQGGDVIRLMNAAGYDAMAAGNHEFDYGIDQLRANAAAAQFPILAANVRQASAPLEASCVKEVGGKRIGFIGLTTTSTATSTNPSQLAGLTFEDEAAAAKAEIAALAEQTDAIVLLCHMGDNAAAVERTSAQLLDALTDDELAQVAAVVDGHSHTLETEPYTRGDLSVPVVQTGTQLTALGKVELTFDGDSVTAAGAVLDYAAATDYALTEDGAAVKAKVEAALADIQAEQETVLGATLCQTAAPVWGGYIYYDYVESRIVETAYGDFVTDAFVDSAKVFAANNGLDLPVVAVENGGGIGQTMPLGTVTRGDILNAFNHGNLVVALSVTPAQLYTALETGLTMTGQDETGLLVRERVSGSFLQAGGFSYAYDPAGETGGKVTQVTLDDGTELARTDDTTQLLLATNNYVATFDGLKEGTQLGELGGEDLIVEEYLLAQTENGAVPLSYPITQGRIRIAGDKSPATYTVTLPVLTKAGEEETPLANQTVHLRVDDGAYTARTTDGSGNLTLTLDKGPHTLYLQESADGQPSYVNNYSGSGTVTTKAGYYRLGFLAEKAAAPSYSSGGRRDEDRRGETTGADDAPETGNTPSAATYADVVKDSWYEAGVTYVTEKGLFQGVGEDRFAPNDNMTRGMLMTVLARLNGQDTTGGSIWYAKGMEWATAQGVSDGTDPEGKITREQLAVMLYRYAGNPEVDAADLAEFVDGEAVSGWAQAAIQWAVQNGILTGKDGARLDPQGSATRAEVAVILQRFAAED